MKINFDKNSLAISRSKVVTGVISIVPADDKFFPEKDWNDAIVVILHSWIENMLQIRGGYNEAEFVFFDGPFLFRITKQTSGFTITLFGDSKETGVFDIDFSAFADNLVSLSRKMLEEAKARRWESDDLARLESALKRSVSRKL